MNAFLKTFSAAACTALLLTACGGGNDDDPTPSDQPGVLTVSNATVSGLNGVYGDGTINLTDVDKKNPVGSSPEVCTFRFDGAKKVGSSDLASGDVRYQPNAGNLYIAFLTFSQREFSATDWSDTTVSRDSNQVRLLSKTLTATDGSGDRITVSGIVPMRGNRPSGC
ncbi:hypothetical protein M5C96_22025 [Acidovorax sp. GBBC 1281]|uniref:hypothetical protein n=1 Tax=unclassified Acidovorax TaxID=2684926 RepID=UPI0023492A84|nr:MULTISPECIES: hypothetical protein [unclassified Acidovorax]WCM97056.1 hypothetical protein M5C96_22025 [Acidovorax sp. GBBC 1281]